MRIAATALLALLPVSVGCGGGATDPPDEPGVIHLTAANRFSPSDVTIDPGETVRWINDAAIAHTVTPENAGQPGGFARTTTSQPGTVLTHTFPQSGTFSYFCEPHLAEGMIGVIRVR